MAEHQKHGFDFEDWVRVTFTTSPAGKRNAKWDIESPRYKSKYGKYTDRYTGLPVSIKVRKYGQGVQFGDVLRQYQVKQDFLLIVGFWEQSGQVKRFKDVSVTRVIAKQWRDLFAEVIPPDGEKTNRLTAPKMGKIITDFNEMVKNPDLSVYRTRKMAAQVKKTIPRMTMSIHQKIDNDQRRVQCSLRFTVFLTKFAVMQPRDKDDSQRATLWGLTVPDFY
jgi:hypothetical protein